MITVHILRISPDKKEIELNLETLSNYRFNNMYMWEYDDPNKFIVNESTINLGVLFAKENEKEILNINLADNNLKENTLYYVQIDILWNTVGIEYPEGSSSEDKIQICAIADLVSLYFYKLKMFKIIDKCFDVRSKIVEISIYEDLFKSSLLLERWNDADFWFSLIKKELNNPILE